MVLYKCGRGGEWAETVEVWGMWRMGGHSGSERGRERERGGEKEVER